MQSAINFGLAQTLKSEITVSGGRVDQSNFNDYEVLRMNEAPPVIEVHIVPSAERPGAIPAPRRALELGQCATPVPVAQASTDTRSPS